MNAKDFHRSISLYELGVTIDSDTLELYNRIKSIYDNLKQFYIRNRSFIYYGNSTDDILFYYSENSKCIFLCIQRVNLSEMITIKDILRIYIQKEYNLDVNHVQFVQLFRNRNLTEL